VGSPQLGAPQMGAAQLGAAQTGVATIGCSKTKCDATAGEAQLGADADIQLVWWGTIGAPTSGSGITSRVFKWIKQQNF
jgi:hypothetical protein